MIQVLSELEKQQDMRAVDAALKRHEAISAEVYAGVCAFDAGQGEIHTVTSGTSKWPSVYSLQHRRLGYKLWEILQMNSRRKSTMQFRTSSKGIVHS